MHPKVFTSHQIKLDTIDCQKLCTENGHVGGKSKYKVFITSLAFWAGHIIVDHHTKGEDKILDSF